MELAQRALDHLPDDVTMPEVIERPNYLHQFGDSHFRELTTGNYRNNYRLRP